MITRRMIRRHQFQRQRCPAQCTQQQIVEIVGHRRPTNRCFQLCDCNNEACVASRSMAAPRLAEITFSASSSGVVHTRLCAALSSPKIPQSLSRTKSAKQPLIAHRLTQTRHVPTQADRLPVPQWPAGRRQAVASAGSQTPRWEYLP